MSFSFALLNSRERVHAQGFQCTVLWNIDTAKEDARKYIESQFDFFVNSSLDEARNTFSDESDANFTIVKVPQNVNVNRICPDSIFISWNKNNK